MKLQITCPGCRKGYVLDGDAAGTEFTCPACMTRCRIGVPTPVGSRPEAAPRAESPGPAAVTPPAPSPTGSQTDTQTGAPAATQASSLDAAPSDRTPEMVVCPRCNLHFKLRGQATAKVDSNRPRILIVEEEGFFRQTAQDALDTHCAIETATTVPEAEAVLAKGGIDLMVLDITLDGGDGKRLLRRGVLKPCPILIYTARDVSEMYGQAWEELQSLGADDIVFQGLNVAESLSRKAAALLGARWADDDSESD